MKVNGHNILYHLHNVMVVQYQWLLRMNIKTGLICNIREFLGQNVFKLGIEPVVVIQVVVDSPIMLAVEI